MEPAANPRFNAQICQEACEWLVEFRTGEPDEAARKAFHGWLKESPRHMAAYLEMTAIWSAGASLDAQQKFPFEVLIAQAAAGADNVVSLPVATAEAIMAPPPAREAWRPKAGLLWAASLAVLSVGAALVVGFLRDPGYSTAAGEQRVITLPDGSIVNLNSRSSIRVRYSEGERLIELREGQALFSVARNPGRPFVVSSGDVAVRAVGTQFDVYRKRTGTVVTVVEGRVAILEDAASRTQRPEHEALPVLSAGEQVTLLANSRPKRTRANLVSAIAWTQRQLVFESAPLSEVAEEFNRYNGRQIIIRDPELDGFQIDGVFSSTDPGSLIRFLRARPGVQVSETDDGIVISGR